MIHKKRRGGPFVKEVARSELKDVNHRSSKLPDIRPPPLPCEKRKTKQTEIRDKESTRKTRERRMRRIGERRKERQLVGESLEVGRLKPQDTKSRPKPCASKEAQALVH